MMHGWMIAPMLALLSAAPLPSDDAAVIRAALEKVGSADTTARCVSPRLVGRPFEDMRHTMGEAPAMRDIAPDVRKAAVRQWAAQARWLGANDKPLPAQQRQALDDAIVALLLRDPFPPPATGSEPVADGPQIPSGLLQPGQQLQPTVGCLSVTLSNVARHGDLAFVDVGIVAGPLAGTGDQWAFLRDRTGWRWIAGYRTWVS